MRVAGLFADVDSAVEGPDAGVCALVAAFEPRRERLGAVFCWWDELAVVVRLVWCIPLVAGDVFPLLAAVADGWDGDLASAAEPGVALLRAGVLAAWEEVTADLVAAPALAVLCVDAPFRGDVLSAVTGLSRTHERTRRTRTGVTG